MIHERWELIGEILRKKSLSQVDASRLRDSIVELLATAEGRASIRTRMNGKADALPRRQRFFDEVFRALDDPAPPLAEMSALDRVEMQVSVVEWTKPKSDQAHWNMLWLLQRDRYPRAGQMVLNAVAKVTRKRDDLARTLPQLPAWAGIPRDRLAPLLEAASGVCRDFELAHRLDRVLSWAKAAHSTGMGIPAQSPDGNLPTEGRALPVLLGEIERLFQRLRGDQESLRQERDEAEATVDELRGKLQIQTGLTETYLAKINALEKTLSERARELVVARDEARCMKEQLAETQRDLEATRRRAEDYIHEATLARDGAVRGFQASVWARLRPYLVEVIDSPPEPTALNEDQLFFRHRLEEIRDTLRACKVPPD